MAETRFLNGFRVYPPREKAPDFVKGAIVINSQEIIDAIISEGKDEIRLSLNISKAGNLYACINDYEKKEPTANAVDQNAAIEEGFAEDVTNAFDAEEEIVIPSEEEMW